eukprot:Nk52_evm24s2568 gene=Nk52_evmTU24s2568
MSSFMDTIKKIMKTKVFQVWLLVAIYMFARAFDRVLARRWTVQMSNYSYLSGSIIFPIGIWLVSFLLLAGAWALGKVPPSSRMMNQWPYMIVAVLDGTNALLDTTAGAFIPGQLENAITQLVIPFTMVISYFWLKRRYQGAHYLAGFLIVYGVCLNIQPTFEGKQLKVQGPNDTWYDTSIWFVLLDVVAFIPAAFSNCYKEYTLKGKSISVFWFMVFNGFYQVIWGFITIPYAFIHWPAPKDGADAEPSELGEMFKDGFNCFFGIARGPNDTEEKCNDAYLWFFLFLIFNVTFNITFLKISKEVSAAFAAIVAAGTFILVDFLFLSEDLAGIVQPLESYMVFAMIIVAVAIVIYGTHNELDQDGNEVDHMETDVTGEENELYLDSAIPVEADKKV